MDNGCGQGPRNRLCDIVDDLNFRADFVAQDVVVGPLPEDFTRKGVRPLLGGDSDGQLSDDAIDYFWLLLLVVLFLE